jgi:chromatin segregation and condensation protein Rec8/ScpA/Scc1 (kleisin family)
VLRKLGKYVLQVKRIVEKSRILVQMKRNRVQMNLRQHRSGEQNSRKKSRADEKKSRTDEFEALSIRRTGAESMVSSINNEIKLNRRREKSTTKG